MFICKMLIILRWGALDKHVYGVFHKTFIEIVRKTSIDKNRCLFFKIYTIPISLRQKH